MRFGMISPSSAIGVGVDYAIPVFRAGGAHFVAFCRYVADIFSIKDIAIGAHELFHVIGRAFWVPYHFFGGAIEIFMQDPTTYAIALGTGLPLAALVLLLLQRNAPEPLKPIYVLTKMHGGIRYVYDPFAEWFMELGAIYIVLKLDHVIEDLIAISKPIRDIIETPIRAVWRAFIKLVEGRKAMVMAIGITSIFALSHYGYFIMYGRIMTPRVAVEAFTSAFSF